MTSHHTPAEAGLPSLPPLSDADQLIEALSKNIRLRAGGFIVTIYGDVVEPRGGHVWMGNLIETCASVGINESLVRTAVSRLVAADRLKGSREGRKSYYSLSDAAQGEFLAAAKRIFGPVEPQDWCFVWLPDSATEADQVVLEGVGFRRTGAGWWLGPRGHLPQSAKGLVLAADMLGDRDLIRSMAAGLWDWTPLSEAYQAFVTGFTPILVALEQGMAIRPDQMLQLRLLMVHQFRQVALRDPDLPLAARPEPWIGHQARALFAMLYRLLSGGADAYIARQFVSVDGPLPATTAMVERRLVLLAG
jgi:phenylacetic acid degradation operon negative regulatory protein